MMQYKTFLLFVLFFIPAVPVRSQESRPIRDIVEMVAERSGDDFDVYEFTEQLNYYSAHPIDLNKAKEEDLKPLLFLSPLQINNLLAHKAKNGRLIDMMELQGIDGFDIQTIEMLSQFTKVGNVDLVNQIKDNFSKGISTNDLIVRYGSVLQEPKGYRDLPGSKYLGSKDKFLLRYRYQLSKSISAALVLEKDPGEYWLKNKLGFDHISGNISLSNLGKISKIVIGDYSLQFGEGLTLWSGFSAGKGSDIINVAAKSFGLRPYASSNEASFFRGLGVSLNLSNCLTTTSFISIRHRDASLKQQLDSSYTLQTFNISGLHRTSTEHKNRNSVGQYIIGSTIDYHKNSLNIGMIGYHSGFEHEFVTGTQLYNKYSFTGNSLWNVGVYYNLSFKNAYTFGEAAHSLSTGWAIIHGVLINLNPKISSALVLRNYQKNYHNFFSNGIGENTDTNNEKGAYLGVNFSLNKHLSYSIYTDLFKFPWLKYRVDQPSAGYELLSQCIYAPLKSSKYLIRFKREIKEQNAGANDPTPGIKQVTKQSLRIGADYQLNSFLSIQQRLELATYKKGSSSSELGRLIYTDFNLKPRGSKVSGNCRIAYFNTPSYDSRIYAYEDDVLYGATSGIYSDNGIRSFLNLRYRLKKGLDCWARYAIYVYADKSSIGSGLDEISGNLKSDAKVQLRYQF